MFDNLAIWEISGKLVVGALALRLLFSLFRGLYGTLIASALGLNANLPKYGKWAVITGSTDGIGKAFALELAKRGMDIILISRSPSKLQSVAAEISEKHGRETKTITANFTSVDIYEWIRKELQNLEIGVLVNNVGMALSFPQFYEANDDKILKDVIACNTVSVAMMTKVILPAMKKRKKGMIINVSSLSSIMPFPHLSIYAATKAFVRGLSMSLLIELKNTGVELQCIIPGFVSTNMTRNKRTSIWVPTPTDYVTAALATTGVESITAGYHSHNLLVYIIEFCNNYLPACLLNAKAATIANARRIKIMTNKKE